MWESVSLECIEVYGKGNHCLENGKSVTSLESILSCKKGNQNIRCGDGGCINVVRTTDC